MLRIFFFGAIGSKIENGRKFCERDGSGALKMVVESSETTFLKRECTARS